MLAAVTLVQARSFPVTLDAFGEMDDWIEETCRNWAIDDRTLFRARVCVSELAANVVEHGHVEHHDDTMDLELRNKPSTFENEISAPGVELDPTRAPPVDLSNDRIGGRGLKLVRAYAQPLCYRRVGHRNVITLTLASKPS